VVPRVQVESKVSKRFIRFIVSSVERKQVNIRGLHSSTFRLNVSTFFGIRWVIISPQSIR